MCGNGIRCVCRYLFMRGLVSDSARDLKFNVEGRQIDCQVDDCGRTVKVAMGQPCFDPAKVPVRFDSEVIEGVLPVAGSSFVFSAVSMGNPHCVIFVDELDQIDLAVLGPMIENHELFPRRTNVEFVEVVSDNRIKVKVWERGAGITLACGTGACAVVAAAVRRGFSGSAVQVELPGGLLDVNWESDREQIYLSGPAREICSGVWLGNSVGCR
jgi:diaminopimelate epimerase